MASFSLTLVPTLEQSLVLECAAEEGSRVAGMLATDIPQICDESNFRAHFFEPHPEVFETLHQTVRSDSRLTAINAAVSSAAGRLVFHAPSNFPDFKGGTAAKISPDNPFGQHVSNNVLGEVDAVTLDEHMRHHAIENVHFLKVDVEGYEDQVFAGAFETLEKTPVVVFECRGTFNEEEWPYPAPIEFFRALGYDLWAIQDHGEVYMLDYPFLTSASWHIRLRKPQETNCMAIRRGWPHYEALLRRLRKQSGQDTGVAIYREMRRHGDKIRRCNCWAQ